MKQVKKLKFTLWRLRFFFVVFFSVLMLLCIYLYTPAFRINEVLISSLNNEKIEYLDEETILNDFNIYKGRRFFEVNFDDVKSYFSDKPFAEDVVISKVFPKTLVVLIKEREPFLSLQIEDRKCILMDKEGFVLEIAEESCKKTNAKYSPFQIITDDPKLDFIINTRSTYYNVENITKIIKVLNEKGFGVKIVSVKNMVGTVETGSGKRIIFSFNQRVEDQLSRFVAILSEIEEHSLKYSQIDLRYNRPILKK